MSDILDNPDGHSSDIGMTVNSMMSEPDFENLLDRESYQLQLVCFNLWRLVPHPKLIFLGNISKGGKNAQKSSNRIVRMSFWYHVRSFKFGLKLCFSKISLLPMKKLASCFLAILNCVLVTVLSQSKNSEFQIQGH